MCASRLAAQKGLGVLPQRPDARLLQTGMQQFGMGRLIVTPDCRARQFGNAQNIVQVRDAPDFLGQVERQSREIADLRHQVEYLKVATSIAPSREAVEQSRAVLSELVREIDKCIADLTTGQTE